MREVHRIWVCREAHNVDIHNTCKTEIEEFNSCTKRAKEYAIDELIDASIASCPEEYQIVINCDESIGDDCEQRNMDFLTCGAKKIIKNY